MKTQISFIIRVAFLILMSQSVFAQQTGNTVASGGPLGIYVQLGTNLPSAIHPVDGGVAYSIERRVSGENKWVPIASVSAPASLSDFRSRLEKSMHEVPEPIPMNYIPIDTLWQLVSRYGSMDSLGFWSNVLAVRLAAGMMYFDATAKRGVHYQYRVLLVGKSRRQILVLLSNVESYPQVAILPKLHFYSKITTEKYVVAYWTSGRGSAGNPFTAFCQDGLRGSFRPVAVRRFLTQRKDSIFYGIEDTLVQAYQIYRYFLVPQDYFGNPGIASDTALVGAYSFVEVPLPISMHVTNLDSTGGLRITWKLRNTRALRSLAIYRSVDYDKGYVKLTDLSPQADSYVDQTAKPMVRYFYYIVMTGILGEASPPSAKVFGMYISKIAPLAPAIFGAAGTPDGVRFSILASDNRDVNFRVYRNDGTHKYLRLVSGAVPRTDSVTVFNDTSRALSGNLTYAYAVRAEGASHVLSGFSDTVYVRPGVATHPPTPLGLTATAEGKAIQLYWHDMQPFDDALRGYIVYRRTLNAGKSPGAFVRLSPSFLPADQNHFADTTAEVGLHYDYAVRAVDMFKTQSALSASAQAGIPAVQPIPPAGLTATSTQGGILLQWDRTYQPGLMVYRLYRYQRGAYPIRIATVRPDQTLQFLDDHTEKGQLYFYYLTSVNTEGVESDRGEEVGIRR